MIRTRPRGPAALWAAGLVVASVLVGCSPTPSGAVCDPPVAGVRDGNCPLEVEQRPPAPTDESFPVLGDDAAEVTFDHPGEVVVINFWASWCGPCQYEQPELNVVAEEYADEDVVFLGVDVQDESETNAILHQERLEIPYPSAYDPTTAIAGLFEGVTPSGLPDTVLVDREGRVAVSIIGATTAVELSQVIDLLLAE